MEQALVAGIPSVTRFSLDWTYMYVGARVALVHKWRQGLLYGSRKVVTHPRPYHARFQYLMEKLPRGSRHTPRHGAVNLTHIKHLLIHYRKSPMATFRGEGAIGCHRARNLVDGFPTCL